MSEITFDFALFQSQFPAFEDPPYTSAIVEAQWNIATCYISTENFGCLVDGCRALAINAMTAHLFQLGINSANTAPGGNSKGFIKSATIDKVSVTTQEPPSDQTMFQWWLNQTPYGQQLLALLKVKAVGGRYIGGLPEGQGFRKVFGVF